MDSHQRTIEINEIKNMLVRYRMMLQTQDPSKIPYSEAQIFARIRELEQRLHHLVIEETLDKK